MKTSTLHIMSLLEWIESNLDSELNAEVISVKSGYTKWHLQKMFKSCTGLTLSEYVRGRRLCKAAFDLCFTTRSIVDISHRYRFDSQQSFTRAFSEYYQKSPAKFRHSNELCLGHFMPRYILDSKFKDTKGTYVAFDQLSLEGVEGGYLCQISEMKKPHTPYRWPIRETFIRHLSAECEEIFTLAKFGAHDQHTLMSEYHLGIKKQASENRSYKPLPIIFGDYLRFDHVGKMSEIDEFVLFIYMFELSANHLTRRDGYDLEIFTLRNKEEVSYSYLIPVRFDAHFVKYLSSFSD